ncbi:MAG: DUF2279 domain-containing protein [Bacteroidia bacterium]|nr:DUF2279 domain-containing protein [Bacteroidia bacterium]
MYRFVLTCLLSWVLFAGLRAQQRAFHYQHDFRPQGAFFQNDTLPNPARKRTAIGAAASGYVVTGLYLGFNWYANEPLTRFHFFNDWREWQQIDKFGHALGGYHATKWVTGLCKWSGMPKRQSLVVGGVSGFMAMSTIEVLDGFGEGWGFSWPDIGANFVGASLAVTNQALWNEDRIQLKVSWLPSPYARVDSLQRLFGSTPVEWLLKDYNGQTLWMSFRVHSFLPEGRLKTIWPRWLNVAAGYGAEGLLGNYGREPWAAIQAREYRQYYLGLDVDFSQIRTRSGFLNSLLSVASIFRVPMPAVRFDQQGVSFRVLQ